MLLLRCVEHHVPLTITIDQIGALRRSCSGSAKSETGGL